MFVFGVPVQVSTPPSSSVGSVTINWGNKKIRINRNFLVFVFVFGVPVQVSTPPPSSSVGSVTISWGRIVGRKALAAASTRAAPVFRLLSSATEILSLPENKHAAQLLNGGKAACEVLNEEKREKCHNTQVACLKSSC